MTAMGSGQLKLSGALRQKCYNSDPEALALEGVGDRQAGYDAARRIESPATWPLGWFFDIA